MQEDSERCPVCFGYGAVSRQVGREIRPDVHVYEQRDVPCPRCDREGWLLAAGVTS
jgi:uncharacterized protein with PIN domain